ncbi:MAG: helix-turn-helix transcriptional regulator, partial [Akkermansia sp.]|nr:helix-turn-helix transcriptional regulator [Akkermansia sp.]
MLPWAGRAMRGLVTPLETINQRIAHLRKNRGYTQKELASLLDINYNTYSQLERKGD